jgi:hypothetical protein
MIDPAGSSTGDEAQAGKQQNQAEKHATNFLI